MRRWSDRSLEVVWLSGMDKVEALQWSGTGEQEDEWWSDVV